MITSLSVTKDGTYALVSLSSKQIHLLDLQRGVQLQKYTGHVQGKYVIRSCFGGLHDGFVLSGSEGAWRAGAVAPPTAFRPDEGPG